MKNSEPILTNLNTIRPALIQRLNKQFELWLPAKTQEPQTLHKAMRYSTLNGGKRIRPMLIYATAIANDIPLSIVDGIACSVELLHVYSLIHDDLPCMDDDDLRRGKPTCHITFNEATATLAGDALQALSFRILSVDPTMTDDPLIRLGVIDLLSSAVGSTGMAGGQAIDLDSVGSNLNVKQLETMHNLKTGALINACVMMVVLHATQLSTEQVKSYDTYSRCIGLCFQIMDDILDVTTDTKTLGKPSGSDAEKNKPTFPELIGLDASHKQANALHTQAIESLTHMGKSANLLREIANFIIQRKH